MINFGSAADRFTLIPIELKIRYKGPPVKPVKAKSDGSLTPVNAFSEPLPNRRTIHGSRFKFRKSPSKQKSSGAKGFHLDPYEILHSNWDLVPSTPEKLFPNWDTHQSIPDTFARLSPKTLERLTRHEIVENMPTTPSPHDIAILNILQNKLGTWEKAEEDLFLHNKGWFYESKPVADRAWTSWAMTQNRDFGSAVWRWLKLDDWGTQTPRMKGLL
jgi:hypothetical protein